MIAGTNSENLWPFLQPYCPDWNSPLDSLGHQFQASFHKDPRITQIHEYLSLLYKIEECLCYSMHNFLWNLNPILIIYNP